MKEEGKKDNSTPTAQISQSATVGEIEESKVGDNTLSSFEGGLTGDIKKEERKSKLLPPLTNSQRKLSVRSSRSTTPRGDSHSKSNYYGIDIGCGFIVLSLCDIGNVSIVLENELSKRKT